MSSAREVGRKREGIELPIDSLSEYVRNEILPGVERRDREEAFPLEHFKKLHDLGWLQAVIPTEYGGVGATTTDLLEIGRAIAYGSTGMFTSMLGNLLGLTALIEFAPEDLKEKICTDYVKTFSLFSFCMTEPDAGTDVANIATTATPCEGGYRITGKKCFITNANYSSHLCVFAKIPALEGVKPKITAFYLSGRSKGITRGKPLSKLGQRESNTSEIYFDEVFVPSEHVLGSVGDGLSVLKRCIARSKTLIGAAAVGISERANDITVQFLENRIHYGAPLLSLPTIYSQLALLNTEKEAAWCLTQQAAWCWDSGDSALKESSMAKFFSSDMATRFISECLELNGGYGFSSEFEISRLYRDVRGFEIFEGASLVQLNIIAKQLFPSKRHESDRATRTQATQMKVA